jgi:hypothetical protein
VPKLCPSRSNISKQFQVKPKVCCFCALIDLVFSRRDNYPGKSLSDIKNRLGHDSIESTMIYLHLDLRRKRQVQNAFIEYTQSNLSDDPKINELIDLNSMA